MDSTAIPMPRNRLRLFGSIAGLALVAFAVAVALTLGAPPQKAGAICSSVEAKNPRLYDDGRKIAGNAVAKDCGGLAKVTATLHWGHAVPGFDWLWRPHASKTIRTPGSASHYFGSGTARCNPGIYYTEVKGYNRAGEVVAEDNSELVNTGCNPDNW
jgi:hypothetical protein